MYPGVRLIEEMARRFPGVAESYACHLYNNLGELLPHVFLWDLIDEIVQSMINDDGSLAAWMPVLDFLEVRSTNGDLEDNIVIGDSFLWSLPAPGSRGYAIVALLGPSLAARFAQVRPHG
ncbi:hypothetical protein KO481_00845 [Nocardia sp. NEAU-G5]|uniref:MmyB-like transcription regulator ligand binding domain-containing protein n=1 Tax=Nocardia albiluteola TaxID=2842303 RepID=A0ABS6ARC1_9NOCA|nr:hypothetical protein [Nocardia albiluteola]MBU3060076.1 hypothetical protein [Nocardia albiluteola]